MARALVWFEREVLERRWALGCLLLVVYIPTASYTFLSPDVIGAEIPAWSLATRGTLSFPHHPNPTVPWFFEYEGRFYSDRFPGAILFLVPGYFLAGLLGTDGFSVNPGAISAAVVTAAAILVMDEVYGVTLGSTRAKHVATLFTAFGTGAWSICANAPWSHTLNFLLLALVLSALARDRLGWAGLALGGVVFTRPQWLVAAAVLALVLGVLRRSPTPVARIALGTIPGVVALFAYNGLMFGRWGPSNGHELSGTIQPHWEAVPWNVAGAVLSPSRGLIVYYPIVLIALVGLRPRYATPDRGRSRQPSPG